jgi:hypothetical protein
VVFAQQPETELIAATLARGRLSIPDEYGRQHEVYAVCAQDGLELAPSRIIWVRDASGRHIDRLEFRCPNCKSTWQAAHAELHLR